VNSPATITLAGSGAAPVTHAANLSWTPSSSTFAGFDVYRSNVSGGPYTRINPTMVSSTSFSDTNVVVGQTYYYVATEFDSSGNQSAYSNETSALIP
jgi:fibronectin type 3 domain-containing protein